MKQELVQAFVLQNGKCFDSMAIQDIQARLADVDDSKSGVIMGVNYQNPTVILIIAILLGWDRFFLGQVGTNLLKIFTVYGLGIWWFVDIFSAKKRTYNYNYRKFNEAYLLCK